MKGIVLNCYFILKHITGIRNIFLRCDVMAMKLDALKQLRLSIEYIPHWILDTFGLMPHLIYASKTIILAVRSIHFTIEITEGKRRL